jgi:hypothetical protein
LLYLATVPGNVSNILVIAPNTAFCIEALGLHFLFDIGKICRRNAGKETSMELCETTTTIVLESSLQTLVYAVLRVLSDLSIAVA